MAKMTQKQDDAYDKAHGIKEDSAKDKRMDAKVGVGQAGRKPGQTGRRGSQGSKGKR